MTVLEYLDNRHTHYRFSEHKPAYTAKQLARVENVKPQQVAKTVIVEAEGRFFVCVLPADRIIDFMALRRHLKVKNVCLATEHQMQRLFGDSEIGAEPPIGEPYNLPVLMDKALCKDEEMVFFGGSHKSSVWMDTDDYIRLAKPKIVGFTFPADWPCSDWPGMNPYWMDPFAF